MNRHTRIIKKVIDMYPEAECELDFRDAYELLVATILSAQTTDKQVNLVTVNLFGESDAERSRYFYKKYWAIQYKGKKYYQCIQNYCRGIRWHCP